MKLESKEDFRIFDRIKSEIIEQDIIDFLNGKKRKERQLRVILVLSECLPILCFNNARKYKDFVLSDNTLINKQEFSFNNPEATKQAFLSQEQLEHVLDNTELEHYIIFSCCRRYYYEGGKLNKDGHAMLICKRENNRYIFDANIGVVGFVLKRELHN
ncbi:MAG: hypothetical protein ACR5KV_01815 [Wolbachia sp.]